MRITPTDVLKQIEFENEVNFRADKFIENTLVRVAFDPDNQEVDIHTNDTRSGSDHDRDCITVSYEQFFTADELRELKIENLLK